MTKKPPPTNGWRNGNDPAQRILRILAAIVCLVVFAVMTLDPQRSGNLGALAIASGVLLVLLGYESLSRLPMIGGGKKDEDDDGST